MAFWTKSPNLMPTSFRAIQYLAPVLYFGHTHSIVFYQKPCQSTNGMYALDSRQSCFITSGKPVDRLQMLKKGPSHTQTERYSYNLG